MRGLRIIMKTFRRMQIGIAPLDIGKFMIKLVLFLLLCLDQTRPAPPTTPGPRRKTLGLGPTKRSLLLPNDPDSDEDKENQDPEPGRERRQTPPPLRDLASLVLEKLEVELQQLEDAIDRALQDCRQKLGIRHS
ncbi:early protein 4 [Callithrix penicillata papillomavirus type 1]|uniref:Early protein 4 n=1 Tax=Callithrix penicillata papillomavirus type 1 TaxID=2704503 RepID=A0A6C0TA44_9PAPI|nr:early protein 4 [Callithrix penicillata papillomavirus type 1]